MCCPRDIPLWALPRGGNVRSADRRVVRSLHLRLMRIVAETNAVHGVPDLRLEGGTALAAYHLGHRESEDLDFFAATSINAREFGQAVRKNAEREDLSVQPIGPASLGYAGFVATDAATENSEAVRLDLAASSSFRLAPFEPTAEGIQIASYRDLCAGKLHAICDRFAERDFVDLHVILHHARDDLAVDEALLRTGFNALMRDVIETDPGLTPSLIGQSISRGLDRPIVGELPLRLLIPIADAEIQATLRVCVDQCARLMLGGIVPRPG